MGTPLPPNEPGNPCNLCWGVGKEFGNYSTPRFITMILEGILPGDDWDPDHEQLLLTPHLLDQVITPCDWDIDDGIFRWQYGFTVAGTSCYVTRKSDSRTVFLADTGVDCQIRVPNQLITGWNVIAYNGFANFSWNQGDL